MKSKRRLILLILVTAAAFAAAVLVYLPARMRVGVGGGVEGGGGAAGPPAAAIFRNPYDAIQPFMEGIYAADHTIVAPEGYRIRALIVPHHLTATASIASGLRMLEHQNFKKILLISPDHFNRCPTMACTADRVFKTFFGDVRTASGEVQQLLSSDLVSNSPELFKNEHGIYGVLPYIAHYFPNVTVTPLVLSQKIPWRGSENELLSVVESRLDADTMLIVSSDFSHYLPAQKADEMDEMTAKTIFAKDLNGIAALKNPSQNDCPNCLWLIGSIADKKNFYNPSVILHTNSARILNDNSVTETTSHFSMVWYENSDLDQGDLAVAGDVTLTRAKTIPVLSPVIRDWWAGGGLRLVNLEGPHAKKCDTQTNPYLFCNPEDLWLGIRDIATHWGVMNNHMLDLGLRGFSETKILLLDAGETYVGEKPVDTENIKFYAVTALVNPVKGASSFSISKNNKAVLIDLKKHRDGKFAIVLVHYGTENQTLTSDTENRFLESFIDAGADAVVGCHSHEVSDMRIYKGKPIFHSLGNFIFDQPDSLYTSTSELVRLRKQNSQILFQTLIAPGGS